MDDAYLKILEVDQKGLVPLFDKDLLDYEIVVSSSVLNLKVNAVTSDKGASFSIKSDCTGWAENGEIKLVEGNSKILIEVTSEDGTIKKYVVNCSKLSASSASLRTLKSKNDLLLNFDKDIFEYEVIVGYKVVDFEFNYEIFDPECEVKVTSNKKIIDYDAHQNMFVTKLNYGFTTINICVESPDKSYLQRYNVTIIRKAFPRLSVFQSTTEELNFQDSISLSPIHCAFKINKTGYSLNFIDFFQKIASSDLLNEISLSIEENQYAAKTVLFNYIDFEESISNTMVHSPLLNGDFTSEIKLADLSKQITEINQNDIPENDLYTNIDIDNIVKTKNLPFYQLYQWEKNLQIIYDETDSKILQEKSKTHFEKYLVSSEKIEIDCLKKMDTIIDRENEESPIYSLNMSLFCISTSLKYDPHNIENHIKLGMLLEEKNFFENIYGFQVKEEITDSLHLNNQAAAESSKEDDINAICVLRKFGPKPSNHEILKALDQEYHYCLEIGQYHKADQVQDLYLYKSKKISESSQINNVPSDTVEKDLLKKSNQKYLDAMSLVLEKKKTHFYLSLLIGRSYIMIGEYDNSLIYLQECLIWADNIYQTLSRFYFAFSMCKLSGLVNESNIETITHYMKCGLQLYLVNISSHYRNKKKFLAEDHFNIFNTIFLEAFILLGKIKEEFHLKQNVISSENAYRYSAFLSCIALNELNNQTKIDQIYQQSNLLNDLKEILIESHMKLINNNVIRLMNEKFEIERQLLSNKCIGLLNLIRCSTNKHDEKIFWAQEKICQALVYSAPLDPYNLLLLACSKFDLYEFLLDNKKQIYDDEYFSAFLTDCEKILLSGISLQLNINNDVVPSDITEMKWWKEFHESLLNKDKKRKETINKTACSSKEISETKKVVKASSNSKRLVPAKEKKKNNLQKNSSLKAEDTKIHSENIRNENINNELAKKYIKKKSKFNSFIVHYQTQLYLARVYKRMNDLEKASNYYESVIQKDCKNQDPYVEFANMLVEHGEAERAIDVYASYPLNYNNSIDRPASATNPPFKLREFKNRKNNVQNRIEITNYSDAYICGELVRILMNEKKFDDTRLPKYLILWGKLLGISVIEKDILKLNKSNKTKICKEVYAGINNKSIDDPDLLQFFAFKGW